MYSKDNEAIELLRSVIRAHEGGCDNYDMGPTMIPIYDFVNAYDKEQARPKCNCGCWGDPGCCGHHPNCPMKAVEG